MYIDIICTVLNRVWGREKTMGKHSVQYYKAFFPVPLVPLSTFFPFPLSPFSLFPLFSFFFFFLFNRFFPLFPFFSPSPPFHHVPLFIAFFPCSSFSLLGTYVGFEILHDSRMSDFIMLSLICYFYVCTNYARRSL